MNLFAVVHMCHFAHQRIGQQQNMDQNQLNQIISKGYSHNSKNIKT